MTRRWLIESGDEMFFDTESSCLSIKDHRTDGPFICGSDDKQLANFIKSEQDFIEFAIVVATIAGLGVEKHQVRFPHNWAVIFR